MTPNALTTASKAASGNGKACASACCQRTRSPPGKDLA